MRRMIKDFVEIRDYTSLDTLIEMLIEVRDGLGTDANPEVRLRGDDVFGRQLSIAYLRPQTVEEAECDARYAAAYRESRERELARLEAESGEDSTAPGRRRGGLRAVA